MSLAAKYPLIKLALFELVDALRFKAVCIHRFPISLHLSLSVVWALFVWKASGADQTFRAAANPAARPVYAAGKIGAAAAVASVARLSEDC